MVFQPPHDSHLPTHLEWTEPQDWQVKEADLAICPYGYKKGTKSARAIIRDLTEDRATFGQLH
jgi:hypothetical protein